MPLPDAPTRPTNWLPTRAGDELGDQPLTTEVVVGVGGVEGGQALVRADVDPPRGRGIGRRREELGPVADQLEIGDVADQLVFGLAELPPALDVFLAEASSRSAADVRAQALLQRWIAAGTPPLLSMISDTGIRSAARPA